MRKIILFLKNECAGWNKWEVSWLVIACAIITGLSIYWGDNLMGIVSATAGVACVVCTGKGKLFAYIFGLVNCVLYAIISYKAHLYGETMLNAIYYIPMQFVGFYAWSRHMNMETHEVEKRCMSWKNRILSLVTIIVSTYLYGLLLQYLGDAMPFVDSFTTVSSVIAMIISIRMFAEQWWLWCGVNVFSILMWYCDFKTGSGNAATMLMWCTYLVNSILMCIKWEKEVHNNKSNKS